MEAILLGALMVKYDTVVSTFRDLEPFLNIERNSEGFYQTIIVVKCLFVFYAMENSVPKFWMLLFTAFSKGYFIYMNIEQAAYTYVGLILHCVNICFAQMALMAVLAISSEPFEFLLDVYVLFCTLYYACQTYKREIHKLVAIICFSMSVGSYVNNIQRAEIFRFGVYYLLVMLCLASVFPFLPRRKKYGQRLVFYYMLLTLWIVYRGGQHCNDEGLQYGSKRDVCSVTQHIYESQHCSLNETLERLRDIPIYREMKKVDLKAGKLSGERKGVKSRVNLKEASCKHNLIPDVSCSAKVYSTERENLVTEIKEMPDDTINPEIGRIEATEHDRESMTDMKRDSTEQESSKTEIKERIDGTVKPEMERNKVTKNDKASAESYKLRLNFDDKKNLLEEDNSNLEEKMFAENIQDWKEYPLEDEMFSANLFQMNETNGYAEYMEDTTESFPVTEISDDDIDYDFVNRFGNVEVIDNEVRLESANEALKFQSEQRHQKDEFVAGIQPLYGNNEREEKLTRAETEIKQINLQAAEPYVGKEKDAIKKAVPTRALTGETKKVKTGLLELAELGASENRLLITKEFQQGTEDSTENEFKFNAVGDPSGKEYELSNATNFDARDIKLEGLGENQLKQAEIRHSEESSSGTTRLETSKMVPRVSEPKQLKEREIGYFTASENGVSHARIEELEIPEAGDLGAREIQPSEAVGPKESSLEATKAKETEKAHEGSELGCTKTGVPRAFEREPTKQGEFRYSFSNVLNKVNLRPENGLQTTTVNYVATEIEPINVTDLKDGPFKPTKSGGGQTESAICSEIIKPQINNVEELEGIKFEMPERSKGCIDVSKNLPILVETRESGYLNKASESKEFGYKAKKNDNFGASEIEVPESKERGELEKQDIKVNPSSKMEPEGNTFQSNGPTVASVPYELKSPEITTKHPKFESSNVRPTENELLDGNSKLIQLNTEIKSPVDNEKIKAYKKEEPEKEIDGTSEIAEKERKETQTVGRVENIVNGNKKSETRSHFLKSGSLTSESDTASIKESNPAEEFSKTEMVTVGVERPEKMSSKGYVPPHWSAHGDIVATEIRGIGATETIPDTYRTAETVDGRHLAKADGQEVFQSAFTDGVDTREFSN